MDKLISCVFLINITLFVVSTLCYCNGKIAVGNNLINTNNM